MKIDIIGRGNVATHLAEALKHTDDVIMVEPRQFTGLRNDSDLYIIAVSDNAIESVAGRLTSMINGEAVMAHTSGTTPLSAISGLHEHTGVFYPLQTFTKDVKLDYSVIPFLIEGSREKAADRLSEAAGHISNEVHPCDSDKRMHLHLASVVACNFANHLWTLASDYLKERDIDFSLLLPLLDETTRKIHRLPPEQAQTGPASRRDSKTINRHLEMLYDNEALRDIYGKITDSIISHKN